MFTRIRNLFTPRLTGREWADINGRFPKLFQLYARGILTEKETARKYRATR